MSQKAEKTSLSRAGRMMEGLVGIEKGGLVDDAAGPFVLDAVEAEG